MIHKSADSEQAVVSTLC